jgi:hypothetical protein
MGPVLSTSEEEYDGRVELPAGIEEQYGFKINPVSGVYIVFCKYVSS